MTRTPRSASTARATPAGLAEALRRAALRRMEAKSHRAEALAAETCGDWERTFFAMLARAAGGGGRSEIFMRWALMLDLRAAAKHRDDRTQIEAIFLGTAGLLETGSATEAVSKSCGFTERNGEKLSLSKFELSQTKFQLTQTNFSATQGCGEPTLQEATAGAGYAATLRREFAFLRHKFSLRTMDARLWQTGSHRPQSAAPLRLAQLAAMFHKGLTLSQILETTAPEALRRLLQAAPADFWRTHYTLDVPAAPHSTALSAAAADLMLINAAAPLICAYGRAAGRAGSEQQALALWASLGPECNRVTTAWAGRGLQARSALESQAQLQIEAEYCRAERCADCPVRAWCAVGARQPEKDS